MIAAVDLAVAVGVVEELRDVEVLAVDAEGRLPGQPRQIDRQRHRRIVGAVEPHRLQPIGGARGEAGADALDVALHRHVDDPAPVRRDRRAGQVALDERVPAQRAPDVDDEDAQVALRRSRG